MNNMTGKVRHSGVVETTSKAGVRVRIVQTSACASCKIAGHCNASESKVKHIDVARVEVDGLKVGDTVSVSASQSVVAKALLLSFGVPFVLLVTVLAIVFMVTDNDVLAGCASIASLLPYYVLLYCLKDKVGRSVVFTIDGRE
jgi:positive regulator of sigma E activity